MNRIDRLFSILLQLQHRSRLRGADLAAQFGISQRTIYRDIAALHEMGVPIVSLPGEGYELAPGYYLPPLLFTPDEAQVVFLGTQMLKQQARGEMTAAAETALIKLEQVLPPATRKHVAQITAVIEFYTQDKSFDLDDKRIMQLLSAIQTQQCLWMRYFSYKQETWTERTVEPYGLTYSGGNWYLNGYCRLRQGWRSFRVGRIEGLRILGETFAVRDRLNVESMTIIEAQIRFEEPIVRWVRERQHYAFVSDTAVEGGAMLGTYRVHDLRELIPWLLSWGNMAEPIHPPALRQEIAAIAQKLVEKLT